MPKQKKAAAKPELKVKVRPELKAKPKKLDRTLKNGKKTVHAKTKVDVKVDVFAKTDAKASCAKPVVLKLPRPLKKAARACAKAQGLKLRLWIMELIKIQVAKELASAPAKSLQTA